jgi:AraC-like DNA-binding protein
LTAIGETRLPHTDPGEVARGGEREASGGQTYRERRPVRALADVLATVWVQQVAADAAPYVHRTIPHGSVEVSVEIGSRLQVIGPQTGPTVGTLAPGAAMVGVRFHPGVAPAVLRVPACELVDRLVAGDELWGRRAVELGEAIAAAPSLEHATVIVEQAVFDLLADAARPDPIVVEAVRQLLPWGAADVGSLTSSLYLSERQLRRRLVSAIGLAPKVLHRMLRFQGFLALAHTRQPYDPDLASLAADTGYADQPHLTRESLRLSGLTPRALLREAEESCVGIHDHAASRMPLLRRHAARA